MAAVGWYPDPGGAPGRFRYWDGRIWSEQTSDDPSQPPPTITGSAAPSATGRSAGPRTLIILGAVLVSTLLVVVLIVRSLIGDDDGTLPDPDPPRSTVSGWDDSSPIPTASPTATADPSGRAAPGGSVACARADPAVRGDHPTDGRLHGGRLSMPIPGGGWRRDDGYAQGNTWAHDMSGARQTVEPAWWAMLAVGELWSTDGFHRPRQSAEAAMECISSSGYYQYFTGRRQVFSRSIRVDGHTGWALRSEVRVDDPRVRAEGDVVEVIVIDTGDRGRLSYFAGFVPIDDRPRIAVLDRTIADLRVS